MRITVDLFDRQVAALDTIAKMRKLPRAALIREAIKHYLATRSQPASFDGFECAFGLWGDRTIDGLDYQQKIRSEW